MKIIGITMGDPASIGPEITAKALSDPALQAAGGGRRRGDGGGLKDYRTLRQAENP